MRLFTRTRLVAVALAGGGCALALGELLAPTACSSASGGGGTGTLNPAGPPIVIGVPNEETGSLMGNRRAFNTAVQLAEQQINASGGILGRQITFTVRDDTSTAAEATSVSEGLIAGGALALVGPGGSSLVAAVEPLAPKDSVVEVSASATAVSLTSDQSNSSGWFFRTVPNDSLQGKAVALFALNGPHPDAGSGQCHTMDVVHNTDAYGMPLAATLESVFKAAGGTVISDIGVNENAAGSYMTQVNQIVSMDKPDCLVLAVYAPVGDVFLQNLADAITASPGTLPQGFFVIATDGCYDNTFITGGSASHDASVDSWVNGSYPGAPPVYGTVAYTNNHQRKQYIDLLSLYVADIGLPTGASDMDPYTSTEYDAAVLIALAIQAAGSTSDPKAIQAAMFNVSHGKGSNAAPFGPAQLPEAIATLRTGGDINYQGASGDVDFSPSGDVISDFLVWQVQGGAFANHSSISDLALGTDGGS